MRKSVLVCGVFVLLACKSIPTTTSGSGSVAVVQTPVLDFDLEAVEGTRMFLDPAIAQNVGVAVCGDHFPVGSQGFQNVSEVVDFFNTAPLSPFSMSLVTTNAHIPESQLFGCGTDLHSLFSTADIYICMLDNGFNINGCGSSGQDFTATAFVAKYVASSQQWRCCTNTNGELYNKAVLCLNKESNNNPSLPDFNEYFNDPMGNGSLAPSVGVLYHEIGHMLHMGHNNDRLVSYYQIFDGFCNWRGEGTAPIGLTENEDKRSPRITGYTRKVWDDIYGPGRNENGDQFEWVMHELINQRDSNGNVVWNSTHYYGKINPQTLRLDGGVLKDVDNGQNATFYIQFSNSRFRPLPPNFSAVQLRVSLKNNIGNSLVLYEGDITIRFPEDYAQFDIVATDFDAISSSDFNAFVGAQSFIEFQINGNNTWNEFTDADNILKYDVTVVP